MKNDFLKIEDIRYTKTNLNQTKWAMAIGSTFRTYQARLNGSQPDWKLEELIKASNYNGGKVIVNSYGTDYKIHIQKVDD